MNRFSIFLLIAIVLPVFSFAQSAFQPGVVVNLKGDTLHGFINYKEWDNNPRSIMFKATANASPQNLTPNDIKFFSASVGHLAEYTGYLGTVSTNSTDTHQISIADSSVKQDTVFLKVIQHGKNLLLLSMSDNQKVRFFIASNFSDKPVELVYRLYWKDNAAGSTDKTVYDNSFKRQVYDAAENAGVMTPALKKHIQAAEYKADDLESIAAEINGISVTDSTKNNPVKPKGLSTTLAIVGGVVIILAAIIEIASQKSN